MVQSREVDSATVMYSPESVTLQQDQNMRAACREDIFSRISKKELALNQSFSGSTEKRIKGSKSRSLSDVDLCLDEFAHFRGVHVDTARRWFQKGREVPARKVGDRWLVRLGDAILNREGYIFKPDDFVYFNRAHLQKRQSRKRGPNIAENIAAKKAREETKRLD